MMIDFSRSALLIVLALGSLTLSDASDIVDIRRSVGSTIYHLCSGVIVDSEWVLSTRDCSNRIHSLVGGETNSDVIEGTEQIVSFVSKVDNPDYDISLIKVTPPFVFNGNVQPSVLTSSDVIIVNGTILSTSGWNPATNGGYFQPLLQNFNDLVTSPADESCKYGPSGEEYICITGEGSERCAGEKGSPLHCNNGSEKILCALTVSKGDCFQSSPNDLPPPATIQQVGLLTSYFVDWILETINQS